MSLKLHLDSRMKSKLEKLEENRKLYEENQKLLDSILDDLKRVHPDHARPIREQLTKEQKKITEAIIKNNLEKKLLHAAMAERNSAIKRAFTRYEEGLRKSHHSPSRSRKLRSSSSVLGGRRTRHRR